MTGQRTKQLPKRSLARRAPQSPVQIHRAGWPSAEAIIVAFIAAASVAAPAAALRYGSILALVVIIGRARTFQPGWADLAAVLLLVWSIASMLWTISVEETSFVTKYQLGATLIFVATRAASRNLPDLSAICAGYFAGCVLTLFRLQVENKGAILSFDFALTNERLGVQGINPNYSAYAFATAGIFVILLLSCSLTRRMKTGTLIVAPLLYIGIVQTGSRGALVAAVALVLWVVAHRCLGRLALSALYLVVVVSALSTVFGWIDALIRPARTSLRESGDLNGRLVLWPIAREQIAEHPFIGQGAGTFRVLNPYNLVAHNALLEVGVGLGVIGLGLFVITLVSASVIDTRLIADKKARALVIGSLLATSVPILLSGHWSQSPAAWLAFGVVGSMGTIASVGDPSADMAPGRNGLI